MTSEGAIESLMCTKQISNKKYTDKNQCIFGLKIYYCLYKEKTIDRMECFYIFFQIISAETLLLGYVKLLLNNKKKY